MTTPGDETTPETDETTPAKTPVWWTAVPVLVGAYAVYGLLRGDTGSIWPWGDLVVLAVALVLLAAVLAPRIKARRRP